MADNSNRLAFGSNPPQQSFINPFNTRPNDMTGRTGGTPFSSMSHFTFSGGPFLPPSSTHSTTNNPPFSDSPTTFGSISPQQYKSPPPPTGIETRLPTIPSPPRPQPSASQARLTYSTSTPGLHRHTSNDTNTPTSATSHPSSYPHSGHTVHQHHAPAIHSPVADGGPPFQQTESIHRLYLPSTLASTVTLNITPKVDRGFFVAPEDHEWTCYRRNYFQISVGYNLRCPNPQLLDEGLLQQGVCVDYHGRQERVRGFKLTIGARVYGADVKIIDLVQHTPKRDKGPQIKPALNLMLPGGDVERHRHIETTDTDDPTSASTTSSATGGALSGAIPEGEVPKVVTYERIQFKQATANNGKRRAAQQYFSLVVEAYATILGAKGTEDILIAITKSSPVVVRGRSPGHYSDNIAASQASSAAGDAQKGRGTPVLGGGDGGVTTSTSFLRQEQPSPTSIKSTPTMANQPSTNTPSSLPHSTPVQPTSDPQPDQQNPSGAPNISSTTDLDFLASLEADFNGYQYLPFTLLDPQGKIVVPHDLFYDPHEFPDTHYANMLFNTDPALSFAPPTNDPLQLPNNNAQDTSSTNAPVPPGDFSNLYSGFFDLPTASQDWNMTRAQSNQGSNNSPFPKDQTSQTGSNNGGNGGWKDPSTNWFESIPNTTTQQNFAGLRGSTTAQPPFSLFPGSQQGDGGQTPGGNGNGNGKWMFEFRNSSYGYFPNLPALSEN